MATTMTAAALLDDAERMALPDPEVPERPTRRRFSNEYKLRVLAETDAAPAGSIAAILPREGLYSSHLDSFRMQRMPGHWPVRRANEVRHVTRCWAKSRSFVARTNDFVATSTTRGL